jgi:hypothetical protein
MIHDRFVAHGFVRLPASLFIHESQGFGSNQTCVCVA